MLRGFVGKDPEIRTTNGGVKVAGFSLATSSGGYTKDGKDVPEVTEWHNITAWRSLAERAEKYVRKGCKVFVLGQIKYRSWDGDDGQKHYTTDIIADDIDLLQVPGKEQMSANEQQVGFIKDTVDSYKNKAEKHDDELPF